MPTERQKQIAQRIADLENSFCNPRKIKQAEEYRQELREEGYTDDEITNLLEDSNE